MPNGSDIAGGGEEISKLPPAATNNSPSFPLLTPLEEIFLDLGENVFDLREIIFAVREIVFGLGELFFTPNEIVFSLGEIVFTSREIKLGGRKVEPVLIKIVHGPREIETRSKLIELRVPHIKQPLALQ